MVEIIGHEAGKCPYCGSEDVEYGSFEFCDNDGSYDLYCNECKQTSQEWYSLKYIETIGEKE